MQVKKKQLELDMEQWTDSKLEKGVHQGCILSPCLFNFYAEYIMWNTGLVEAQAGLKIAGRNINNLRYANNNTKINADGDCSYKIKRCLLLGRKAMTNISSVQSLSHVRFFVTP